MASFEGACKADDALLAKLKMAPNSSIDEGPDLTPAEEKKLNEEIIAKLEDPTVIEEFDETSKIRMFRGMITNNKGTDAEKVAEAIEAYGRIGKWRRDHAASCLGTKVRGEHVMNAAMGSLVGGCDHYGHVVWAEKLGDIASIVDHPVSLEEAQAIRMKVMEVVQQVQAQRSLARGVRRYKQIYILDLAHVSLASLLTRPKVMELTKAIMTGATAFFPEVMWKMFIVNAPFIFRSVYSMVSPFIHPVTKEKIRILGSSRYYLPELAAVGVTPNQIPKSLGGTLPDRPVWQIIEELGGAVFKKEDEPAVPKKK